jgi:hypothetical protein
MSDGMPISRYPGVLQIYSGWLNVNPWQLKEGPEQVAPVRVKLFDPESFNVNSGPIEYYPLAATNERIVCGHLKNLWVGPLAGMTPKNDMFEFPQVQEKFVLNAHKPNTLNFSVENADSYDLAFFHQPYNAPMMMLSSNNGRFEVEFDEEPLVNLAINEVGRYATDLRNKGNNNSSTNRNDNAAEQRAYQKMITEETENFTGKKLSGVGIPLYATVMARHKNGTQICQMTHYYMVDVSPNAIAKKQAPQGGNNNNRQTRPGMNPGMNRRP